MILDATANSKVPVSRERLFGWHAALFPTGYSGLSRIRVGGWRDDGGGPMQVVSGPIGRQRVHFEAPPADRLEAETARFLARLNGGTAEPPLIKAGTAHLWFVTLHPSTTVTAASPAPSVICCWHAPMAARSASTACPRRSSVSARPTTTSGTHAEGHARRHRLACTVPRRPGPCARLRPTHPGCGPAKARFWQRTAGRPLNERQVKLINRLLDGFEGKLTTGKWAAIAKCSPDTALRDINDLLAQGVLRKSASGGRSTSYELDLSPGA